MGFFSKKKKYKMDADQAANTLQNVYSACHMKVIVQKASLKEIQQKHSKESRSYRVMLILTCLFLVLVLLAPLAFHSSPATIKPSTSFDGDLELLQHHYNKNDGLYYLSFTGDEVLYDDISILAEDGSTIPVVWIDKDTSTIAFMYTEEEINVLVPSYSGDTLQLLLTPK